MVTPELLQCRELAVLPEPSLTELRPAFASATPCQLEQHWLPAPEPNFAPGIVRTAWHVDQFLVFAELTDHDIFSNATGLNQKTWELGDAFEMFLRPVNQEAYAEFHVTPNNQRLQVRIPSTAAIRAAQRTGQFDQFHVGGELLRTAVWVLPDSKLWCVYAQIPVRSVGEPAPSLAGQQWRFSFSRYDYTHGRTEPVYSSTSAHTRADFHEQEAWRTLRFGTTKEKP